MFALVKNPNTKVKKITVTALILLFLKHAMAISGDKFPGAISS